MKYKELYDSKSQSYDEFPISYTEIDKNSFDYVMPVHWHNEFEILHIISGEFDLYVNNEYNLLKAGDYAFINCKCLHHGEPHNCTYEYIDFDLQILKTKYNYAYQHFIEPLQNGEALTVTTFEHDNGKIDETISSIFSIQKEPTALYEFQVITLLFTIFEHMLSNGLISKNSLSKKYLRQAAIVSNLMHWIDDKYTDVITLSMLAEKSQLSQNYICKIFKEYAGKTPIEYVNEVRIRNICRELERGVGNVTEVATRNGYNDISYFCKVFKKYMGISAKKFSEKRK